MLIKKMVWTLAVTYSDWKLSSGWLESSEGVLLMASISTTCVEAIDSEDGFWQVVKNVSRQQQSFSGVQSPTLTFSIKAMLTILLIYFFRPRDHFPPPLHCMMLSKKKFCSILYFIFNEILLIFSIEKFLVHHTKQYFKIKDILASLPGRGWVSLTNTVYLHCKFLIPKWLPCLSYCFSFLWRLFSINYQFHIRISPS